MATNNDRLSGLVREAQQRAFRLAERDHGLTFKKISLDSSIAYNSIRDYAHGTTIMSIPAVLKLVGIIPDYLLSHLFAPVDRTLTDCVNDIDHDAMLALCTNYIRVYGEGRHPDSPEGVHFAPCEKAKLNACAAQL